MTSVITSLGKDIKTIFKNAVELEIKTNNKADYSIETVMKTSDKASSMYKDKENKDVSSSGEFPLMLLSTNQDYGENNAVKYKYVLLSSSTDFASDTYLSGSFGNSRVVQGAARIMSTERVVPDIKEKTFTSGDEDRNRNSKLACMVCICCYPDHYSLCRSCRVY
jgi:hypothetical protein